MINYKFHLDNGIAYFRSGRFKEAIECIDKSLEMKSDWAIPYFYRAACYHSMEEYDEAMMDYSKAINIDPNMTDAYYNRAKIILTRKDIENTKIENAIKDLEKAVELDPVFQDAYYAMAAAYKKLGDYHKTLECLEKLLQIEPQHIYGRALKKLILQKYII